jgi:hypothetical protein
MSKIEQIGELGRYFGAKMEFSIKIDIMSVHFYLYI